MRNDATPVDSSQPGTNPPPDFTTFMRKYQDMVYSTALRLVANPTQAEDVAQDVFLRAFERWDDLRQSPTAGGWLKTVATNLSLNHLRRYRKRWTLFSELERTGTDGGGRASFEIAGADDFFAAMDGAERRDWIVQAIFRLPDHQRVPLVMYHFDDVPYQEIADRTGVSLAKVKTDISRGRAALARLLSAGGAPRRSP